jgi:hypothetical protein
MFAYDPPQTPQGPQPEISSFQRPAIPAAFFLNNSPARIYLTVVSNLACRSWRWIRCPATSFAAADVASPARRL